MTEETSKRHQWSSQEDTRLKFLIEQYGTAWAKISTHLPGRDTQSCKNRHQYLKRRKRRPADWSEEDEALLKQFVKKHSKAFTEVWRAVAKNVPHKTWQQCEKRWNIINSDGNSATK
ncbi:hypothetical protein Glove_319g33 [Diversispora epigaea]|uniref:Myb-like domain-containing protein n=1 Tax=Diversispora epigaea TaxID=1348612 RepID=A0A397HPH9_9GLOM|nr:hypothetical protein Glove_319g33 [Diversispora epigaea]